MRIPARFLLPIFLIVVLISGCGGGGGGTTPIPPTGTAIIVDHNCTDLTRVPPARITDAKTNLTIAYGHTSHGSQLVTGMDALVAFINGGGLGLSYAPNFFAYGSMLRDNPFSGASDLGAPNFTAWEAATRSYLASHSEVNVVIWSWCGQVGGASEADIINYLSLMSGLEASYPSVKFVYMTGHLDGSGLTGNLHLRNQQIRNYCHTNGKILYDFADIETYDPDGVYYGNKYPTDGCNYDYNNINGTTQTGDPATPTNGDHNWAIDWQNAHTQGTDWYNCSPSHTQALNANLKAYAAWWLWARLAGWDGN